MRANFHDDVLVWCDDAVLVLCERARCQAPRRLGSEYQDIEEECVTRCQLVCVISFLLVPTALAAQGSRHATFPARASSASGVSSVSPAGRPARNPVLLALGGVLGGAAGGLAGGFGGAALEQGGGCRGSDQCGLRGAILGGMAGIAVAAPLGVHIANGRRGSYGQSLILSTLVSTAIGGLAWAVRSEEIAYLMPAAHIATAVVVETRTSRVE